MEKSIEKLYQQAKRFDEGDIYQSREYDIIARHQRELYKKMRGLFGPLIAPLLEEYTACLGDETELECRHFFEQGFLLGRSADK